MSELRLHPLADAAGITLLRFIVMLATLELGGQPVSRGGIWGWAAAVASTPSTAQSGSPGGTPEAGGRNAGRLDFRG